MTRNATRPSPTLRSPWCLVSLIFSTLLFSSCANIDPNPTPLPEPIRPPQSQRAYDSNLQSAKPRGDQQRKTERFVTPPAQRQQGPTYVEANADNLGQNLTGAPITLNLNNFPIPAFINEVFGNRLGMSFSLSPELQNRTDLVSLRLNEPQPPSSLFATARFVLTDYGIAVSERDHVLYFQVAANRPNDTLPLLVSGATLPDVPMMHRPVFQSVPMRVVRSDSMVNWLKDMFIGSDLQITSDPLRNSVLLRGHIDLVRQASQAIELFDQPALKGSHSLVVSPVYTSAEQLGDALIKVLQAEGYDVSETPPLGGVSVIKLKEMQRLLIFAADPAILAVARQWVETLDRQSQEQIENGLFVYEVRNTQAGNIANLLGALGYSATVPAPNLSAMNTSSISSAIGDSVGGSLVSNSPASAVPAVQNSAPLTIVGKPGQGAVVVDSNRNAIIFQGSGQQWLQLRPLLEQLDRPIPSVMIDVMLAEVTLNDKEGLGVNWRNITGSIGGIDYVINTATGLGTTGLNMALNSAGQTKALINAFYDNKQAVIRSSPKLMVRSGEEAHIEVGNEIPVVTGSSQSTTSADAPITQTVQYRKTGVILTIKPTVQASGVVDLVVEQELSEQADTSSNTSDLTPTITNRKVKTSLSLRDGGSVMLAGLISSTKGKGDTGVPFFGDLPYIGKFFKSESTSNNRTELVVMIIPYVIRDFDEAQKLTESYRQQMPLNNAKSLDRRGQNRLPGDPPAPSLSFPGNTTEPEVSSPEATEQP